MNFNKPKYTGKTFGEISKMLEEEKGERFDPISMRGLLGKMKELRNLQEQKKSEMEAEQMQQQMLEQQMMGQQPTVGTEGFAMQNMGAQPGMQMQQPEGQFSREASQSYNQEFALGGALAGMASSIVPGLLSSIGNKNQSGGQNNFRRDPMMYAPVLGGALALLTNRRAAPVERNFVDQGLSTQVAPRQTQFSNVDMSQIERGIQDQARSFTGSNMNVSGGNAGQFIANELGNQSNIMNAIANARLQAQMQDRQTDAMNAQEQARIDQFRQAQAQQQQSVQGMNAQLALQYQDLDDRNLAAFRTNQNNALQTMLGTLGSIGRENTLANMILAGTGYNPFGQFGQQTPTLLQSLSSLFKR